VQGPQSGDELPQALVIVPHEFVGQLGVGQKHWLPALHDSPVGHGPHRAIPLQALVIVPHEFPGHVGVGQVHTLFAPHVSPFGHVGEHPVVPPQPLGAMLHNPAHAFAFGWQHEPASQIPLLAHWMVPLAPQLTTFWQVSFAVPHARPEQGLPVGTHASAPHVAQLSVRPQLSGTAPQRVLHHAGSVVQSHWLVDASQKMPFPVPQMFPQMVLVPQLFGPVPQWSRHQERIGEHASASASPASFASLASLASSASPASVASVASTPASAPASLSAWTNESCAVTSWPGPSDVDASGKGMPSSMPQIFAQLVGAMEAATQSIARPTRRNGRRTSRNIPPSL